MIHWIWAHVSLLVQTLQGRHTFLLKQTSQARASGIEAVSVMRFPRIGAELYVSCWAGENTSILSYYLRRAMIFHIASAAARLRQVLVDTF